MYHITPYSYQQAESLRVDIYPSRRKYKKIDVYNKKGEYICSIGDIRYGDYPTFMNTVGKVQADIHRKRYKQRHEKDRHVVGTAGYYADKILW